MCDWELDTSTLQNILHTTNTIYKRLSHAYNGYICYLSFAAITNSLWNTSFFTSTCKKGMLCPIKQGHLPGFSQTSAQLNATFTSPLFLQKEWWISTSQRGFHTFWVTGRILPAQTWYITGPHLGRAQVEKPAHLLHKRGTFRVLASIIFLLDVRSAKSEVFGQLKVLRL